MIRDFAVSHQIDWWLKISQQLAILSGQSSHYFRSIYSLQKENEIVAGPSGKPSVPMSERSHKLNWWLTAKPLLAACVIQHTLLLSPNPPDSDSQ
jgi:hypothetical protein